MWAWRKPCPHCFLFTKSSTFYAKLSNSFIIFALN